MIVHGDIVAHWVADKIGHTYYTGSGQGIGIEKNGEIVCAVLFEGYTGKAIHIHVAMNPDARMTRQWLQVLFWYAFKQLGVKKIIGTVDSTNEKALKFNRHIGFVEEAIIEEAGKHGDLHILTMTRQQCRFLKD
ncbi:MAG: GNAT family N-acetyltransferase [Pseudomonadota bacterium]|nr:GNAT family N-acetyltransferase [Pseudomonadota bacterium]